MAPRRSNTRGMKIAVLQDDLPPHHVGGGGVIAYRLAKEFVRKGHTVIAITTVQDPAYVGREVVDGIEIYRLYSTYHPRLRAYRSLYNPSIVRHVKELLQRFAPDVVHVHNVHTHLSYCSLLAARRYGGKVVMTEHDAMSFHFGKLPSATDPSSTELSPAAYRESFVRQLAMYRWRYNPFRTPIIRRILRANVDATVAVSHALARALEDNGISVGAVIHNGINVAEWARLANLNAFKELHGLRDQVIFFGGRLSEPKGALHMLKALPALLARAPNAQLLIVGKRDAFAERMVALATELGISESLIFAGWLTGEAVTAAYHAANVVVAPSIYLDPFPTVNLEAFASKKPVVATCFGGSRELVDDGVSGHIVNPLNTEELSAKVLDLLTDTEKAIAFGLAGHARVSAEFTLEKQANAYEQLFATPTQLR